MFKLEGKTAVVTGGGSGMGEEIAKRLRAAGAKVLIADITDVTDKAKAWGCDFRKTDIGEQAEVEAMLDAVMREHGHLDILVNNAGLAMHRKLEDLEFVKAERLFRVNVFGVLYGMAGAAKRMQAGGSIINIASESGIRGMPGLVEYGATKGAVVAATYSAALELGPRKIRVNAICPGAIRTPMSAAQASRLGNSAPMVSALERHGRPDEIAAVAHFLASDDASYVTGQAIAVDGGWNAGTTVKTIDAANL